MLDRTDEKLPLIAKKNKTDVKELNTHLVKLSLTQANAGVCRDNWPSLDFSNTETENTFNAYKKLFNFSNTPLQEKIIIYVLLRSPRHPKLKHIVCEIMKEKNGHAALQNIRHAIKQDVGHDHEKIQRLNHLIPILVKAIRHQDLHQDKVFEDILRAIQNIENKLELTF
jgi:hypothetical protein